jgi:hypothetical protein
LAIIDGYLSQLSPLVLDHSFSFRGSNWDNMDEESGRADGRNSSGIASRSFTRNFHFLIGRRSIALSYYDIPYAAEHANRLVQ